MTMADTPGKGKRDPVGSRTMALRGATVGDYLLATSHARVVSGGQA